MSQSKVMSNIISASNVTLSGGGNLEDKLSIITEDVSSKVSDNPTFTEASTRANIASGESFSTILGKIKKWFSDLPNMFVSKSGGTFNGHVTIDRQIDTTGEDWSKLILGNNIPTGTVKNGRGIIDIYSAGSYYSRIKAGSLTADRSVDLPDKSGTVALTSDIPTDNSQLTNGAGYITSSGSITGTASNVTGTVAIANGGTGATTRLNAAKNLTNEAVSSPGYVIGMTNSWGKFGYTTLAQLKSAMSLNNVNNTADANKSVKYATTAGGGSFSTTYTFGQDANTITVPGLYAIPNDWSNLPSGTAWATLLVIGDGTNTPQSQTLYDQSGNIWTRVKVGSNWSTWNRQYQIEFTNNYNVTSRTTWQEIHGTVSRSIQSVMACPSGRQSNSTFKYYTTFSGTTWYVYYMNTTDYSADGITVWVLT